MKRAFIRLFGCVLSAIGLSMSYDTTFTMLLDDDSTAGVAWAAGTSSTGTGTGCVYGTGDCYPTIPSGFLVSGLTGTCIYNGENVGYFVVLSPWYVGWLNVDYTGAGGVPYGNWPLGDFSNSEAVSMNVTFSGKDSYTMSGNFGATMYGTGGLHSSYGTAEEITWCINNSWGLSVGQLYQGNDNSSYSSWRNRCVLNTEEAGDSNRTYDLYVWSAVYMAYPNKFEELGCCQYSTGASAEDGCKCFYAPATQAYSYNAYGTTDIGTSNRKISTSTVPFYEPFVFYSYKSCQPGYMPTGTITGTDANFAVAFLREYVDSYFDLEAGKLCPESAIDASFTAGWLTDAGVTMYSYKWDNCTKCDDYTAISNSSSFSPTITNFGTATSLTSSDVDKCYVRVKGVKNAIGTFNIVEDCYKE